MGKASVVEFFAVEVAATFGQFLPINRVVVSLILSTFLDQNIHTTSGQ